MSRTMLRRTALAAVALVAALFGTGQAHAAYTACRSDPQLTLSNGVQITLYEDIYDLPSDITRISYTVHIPAGLSVKSIAYQGAVPANLQKVKISADQKQGNYAATTVVSTKTSGIAVSAFMDGTNNGVRTVSASASGQSGQALTSALHVS